MSHPPFLQSGWSVSRQAVAGTSRLIFLSSCFWILASQVSNALIDTNANGLSDLWEKSQNNGQLFSNSFDPAADPDHDGWPNAQEAAAGTNPFDPNPPDGLIHPEITHIPATYAVDPSGNPAIETPEAITITWPTLAGKQYTLLTSPDLAAATWISVDEPRIGTGTTMGNGIPLTQPDGSNPPRLFWRVAVSDVDSDGDGLTNAEEAQLGTNPNSIDTDGDGLTDGDESAGGSNPLAVDSDDDDLNDSEDADPNEVLVDWHCAPEASYAMIEIEDDGTHGSAQDMNDKGEVLFGKAIWAAGEWIHKSHPTITGFIPGTQDIIHPQGWSYEASGGDWRFFNNDRKLLQVGGFVITSGPGTDNGGPFPLFWPQEQSQCSLIYDTSELWNDGYSSALPLGVSNSGEMLIQRNDGILRGVITSGLRIDRFDASGVRVATMDGMDDYHPMATTGQHSDTTPSGWVAINLGRESTETQPATYKVGLWGSDNTYKTLPQEANSWGYPVRITDLPNGKVVLAAGQWTGDVHHGRVFLPNATGNYQYVNSLEAHKIQIFAGDGTAITSDGKLWRNGKLVPLRDLSTKYKELKDEGYSIFPMKANKNGTYLLSISKDVQGPEFNSVEEVIYYLLHTSKDDQSIVKTFILVPVELISDLNNDGQITAADNPLRDAAMASGATDEIKDKGTEFIFQNDTLSNGIWDKEDTDPARPATAKDDDDAEEIRVKVGITEGEVWLEHPAIAKLSFYKTRECKPADKVNLSPTSKFTVSASNPFPDKLFMRADVDDAPTYPEADPQFAGDLVLKIKVGTNGQEIEAVKMKLTVAKQLGAKKFFHAARDYILENNTELFVQNWGYPVANPTVFMRMCVMREEATKMSPYESYWDDAYKGYLDSNPPPGTPFEPSIYTTNGFGIDGAVSADNAMTVVINGNQCDFTDPGLPDPRTTIGRYQRLADLTAMSLLGEPEVTDRCHGRVIIDGKKNQSSSDFDDESALIPGTSFRGSDLAGEDPVTGTTNPGGKYIAQFENGHFEMGAGRVPWPSVAGTLPITDLASNAMGGLSGNYGSSDRNNYPNSFVGFAPMHEEGKGAVFVASGKETNGKGKVKEFYEAAKSSDVPKIPGASVSGALDVINLAMLDSGNTSCALSHKNPDGNHEMYYKGDKHHGMPYYTNTFLRFKAQKPR